MESINNEILTEKEQYINYIKNNTNWLDNINIEDIKKVKQNEFYNTYIILLENGELYIEGICTDKNIKDIYLLGNGNMYKIKYSNEIYPVKEFKNWDELDRYLYNDGQAYKKIIFNDNFIAGLTEKGKVIAIEFYDIFGVNLDYLVNVEDILTKDDGKLYGIKNGKEGKIFINAYWY